MKPNLRTISFLLATAFLSVGCEQVKSLIGSDEEAPAPAPIDPAGAVSSPTGASAAPSQATDPGSMVSDPTTATAAASALTAPAQRFYTTYNMWYAKVDSLSAINYKTGAFIPAGTEVTGINAVSRRFRKDAISFTTSSNGATFTVSFDPKFHPGKSIHDYRNMMFTNKTFDQLVEGLSQEEIDAIKVGSLRVGMSRKAVIIAYGYPPEHATPSLESSHWKYWMNRFEDKLIYFDETGRTCTPPAAASGGL
ncbi:MAG: hypothetical protein V2A76_07125 [Planctomycetota bacterium]